MWRVLVAVVAGLVVGGVVYFAFAVYTWTAIHSGWSQRGIDNFYLATDLIPVLVGAITMWCAHRLLTAREGRRNRLL